MRCLPEEDSLGWGKTVKKPLASDTANAIGVVGGLASTIALYQLEPWLAYVALCLLASWVTSLVYLVRGRTINRIKRGVSEVERHLKDAMFQPDIVVAFTRTSAVFAGILSVRMGIPEILVINRPPSTDPETGVRTFQVGRGVSLDAEVFTGRNLLIVGYITETGSSLQTGIEYLLAQGIPKGRMRIATLYCTHAARKKLPSIFVVHETSEEVLEELPWIDGPYNRV